MNDKDLLRVVERAMQYMAAFDNALQVEWMDNCWARALYDLGFQKEYIAFSKHIQDRDNTDDAPSE